MAAINKYSFKKFIIYAYTGALIWTFTFITLGRKLGQDWHQVAAYVSHYSVYLILFLLFSLAIFYYFWKKRGRK
jgi:membrane protein DedA with SNARE-associated domain